MVEKNLPPDDEYQFPQEEYAASQHSAEQQTVEAEAPAEVQKTGVEKILAVFSDISPVLQRNKRIVIVIIAVLLGYLFLHFGVNHKKNIPVAPTEPQPEQTVVSTPTAQPADNSAMLGSLSSLQEHSSQTRSDIQNLQAQVSDLQNAVSQSQSDNQQLQSAINALADQVKGLSGQLNKLISQGGPKKSGHQLYFHLRAVIPDRAWVASDSGVTETITIGDSVQSYGKVTAIYPQQGVVETSSGRKIEYGPNDR